LKVSPYCPLLPPRQSWRGSDFPVAQLPPVRPNLPLPSLLPQMYLSKLPPPAFFVWYCLLFRTQFPLLVTCGHGLDDISLELPLSISDLLFFHPQAATVLSGCFHTFSTKPGLILSYMFSSDHPLFVFLHRGQTTFDFDDSVKSTALGILCFSPHLTITRILRTNTCVLRPMPSFFRCP